MKENSAQKAIKDFLLNEVLRRDDTISERELKLTEAMIRAKLAELVVQVEKLDDKSSADAYNSYLLTALSLKIILSYSKKLRADAVV